MLKWMSVLRGPLLCAALFLLGAVLVTIGFFVRDPAPERDEDPRMPPMFDR